jgi:UDP-N-acetylmuramoylalanine--D-glutamate ligase
LVVGLGKSGLAACRLLQQVGGRVRVTEQRDTEALQILAGRLRESGVEQVELGHHSRRTLAGCDVVVTSPGIPESALPIQQAQALGIPILSEVELAFRFCAAPLVVVTGTNGKSSVVTMIQRVLDAAHRRAVACGNLGLPFAEVVLSVTTDTIVVVEASSFQLLWVEEFRPAIAVLLNLGTNHLDRHRDRSRYVAAKARLFARQTPQDYAVLNGVDPDVRRLAGRLVAQRVWFGAPGPANPSRFRLDPATCRTLSTNAQAVLQVGRLLDVPDPLIYQAIRAFPGLEHRLEPVATVRGVRLVNDSKSTTPESLLYALACVPGPAVLIIGGRNKGLDFLPLQHALTQARIRGIVLIGESRATLRQLLNGSPTVKECSTLEQALSQAMALAHPGDTILFSPACASFDMFRNFEERGEAFKELARRLGNGIPIPYPLSPNR